MAYIIFASVSWGFARFISKLAVTSGGAWTAALIRSFTFFPVVTVFILWRCKGLPKFTRGSLYAAFAGLLAGLGVIFFRLSVEIYDISLVSPLLRLNVLITVLLSVILLKEKFTARKTLGIVLAMGAIIFLSI